MKVTMQFDLTDPEDERRYDHASSAEDLVANIKFFRRWVEDRRGESLPANEVLENLDRWIGGS